MYGKKITFIVRGICGHPSDLLEWEFLARDFVIQNGYGYAVAVSYATSALTVWVNRKNRAEHFGKILMGYTARGWTVDIIGHSEGTVVATDALKFADWPRIENLHLICGACDSDFGTLGINDALKRQRIENVHCYMAGHDSAMQFESLAAAKILFQIRHPLGLHGPTNVNQQFVAQVHEHWESPWDGYGHSTCWEPANFDNTLNQLVGHNQVQG